jgi:ectoine hydroxylase-related dioxygenase (phytanoyl-CoA dioxygenase family)
MPFIAKRMTVANAALGNDDALQNLWDEEGYWYFKNVLDRDAVEVMRRAHLDALKAVGVVESGQQESIWNGEPMTEEKAAHANQLLGANRVWQSFVEMPRINAFFEKLLGCPVVWLPMNYYRMLPPIDRHADPFLQRHQDGVGLDDVPFRTCWIPLMDIDDATGGLMVASGQHKKGLWPHASILPRIPPEAAPEDTWHRGNYEPGDLVVFRRTVPHGGLPNYSNHFRLSIDIRVMKSTDHLPVFGRLIEIRTDAVVIAREDGAEISYTLDENTWCRAFNEHRLSVGEMANAVQPGQSMMITHRNGRATLLRPQIY